MNRMNWNTMGESDHFVQFYEEDNSLVGAVAHFFAAGFARGEAGVVIAAAAHRRAIGHALKEAGVDTDLLAAEGRFVMRDAAETLALFMVEGRPDRARFTDAVGGLVARMTQGGAGLRAFGEMVALLWERGDSAAAIELEKLWNELRSDHAFSLFCAYPLKSFRGTSNGEIFAHICEEHTHVLVEGEPKLINSRGEDGHETISRLRNRATALEKEAADQQKVQDTLRERTQALELLNRVGSALSAERELEHIVQTVTDAGREIAKAAFGAFFYNVTDASGESYTLYTLSGAPREAFANFPNPRKTQVFAPTFEGRGIVRVGDITKDERYGKSGPHFGMPAGHLPVRSYLAVPVASRTGKVLGGLFFGHPQPDVFSDESENLLLTLAAQAGIAIENSNLYAALERELESAKKGVQFNRRVAAIIESSDDAIIGKNLRGIIQNWNAGAERLFGYAEAEVVGQSVTLLIPPDRIQEEVEILGRISRGERVRHYETKRRRKDGTLVDVSLTISPIKDDAGKVVGASKIARDISERKQAEEALRQAHAELEQRVEERTAELRANSTELEKKNNQLARMASELILTERRERRRLAGLLHDHLQQLLVASLYQLRFLSRRFKGEEANPCTRIVKLLEEGLKTSRTLTVELSPPILHEGGLVPGLQWLARDMEEKHGLHVQLTAAEDAETQREDMRVFLFEAARELLFNVVKHASAGTAQLDLRRGENGGTVLEVSDRGVGFDPPILERAESAKPSGFGLLNIKERIGLLGGRLDVESSPGAGARFTISLPSAQAANYEESAPRPVTK